MSYVLKVYLVIRALRDLENAECVIAFAYPVCSGFDVEFFTDLADCLENLCEFWLV